MIPRLSDFKAALRDMAAPALGVLLMWIVGGLVIWLVCRVAA